MNIKTEEHPKMMTIRDYWENDTLENIVNQVYASKEEEGTSKDKVKYVGSRGLEMCC